MLGRLVLTCCPCRKKKSDWMSDDSKKDRGYATSLFRAQMGKHVLFPSPQINILSILYEDI